MTLRDNQYGCTAVDECAWIEGDGEGCNQPTPKPTDVVTGSPMMEPTLPAAGWCYGSTSSSNSFCAGIDDDARACDATSVCERIETDDPEENELTTTTTPPAPTYGEGCCEGFENVEDC